MDELSDYTSPVLEFRPTQRTSPTAGLLEACTGTDPLPPPQDAATQPPSQSTAGSQTETTCSMATLTADEEDKLARWLRRLLPHVEAELNNPTPNEVPDEPLGELAEQLQIETYQKITAPGGQAEHRGGGGGGGGGGGPTQQGLAIWLAVQTHDAPVLVVTATTPCTDDEEWDGGGDAASALVGQSLKVYQPQRLSGASGNFVVFAEVASLPVKVVRTLTTNPWNKNIFAGATLDGDVFVWQYEPAASPGTEAGSVRELHQVASPHGWAVCLDWASEQRLVAGHSNGWLVQWTTIEKQPLLRLDWEFLLKCPFMTANYEITAMVCLDAGEMVAATKDGGIYQLWHAGLAAAAAAGPKQFEVLPLRQHRFMVTSLLRARLTGSQAGTAVVISCDLSGQLFYHDLRHYADEDGKDTRSANVTAELPLPFKNAVACSREADIVYAPGLDGSLDCYRVRDGQQASIRGALHGKGNFIKCSDNGRWIITGLYDGEFQIFHMADRD